MSENGTLQSRIYDRTKVDRDPTILVLMGAAAGMVNIHSVLGSCSALRSRCAGEFRACPCWVGIMPISLALAGFLVAWSLKWMFLLAGGLVVLATVGASFQRTVRQIE